MAPPFVIWAKGLSTKTVGKDLFFWPSRNFGPKTGLNLSVDFFFGLHLSLGWKTDLVLGWKIFILVFIILKFSGSPLSKILRTLLFVTIQYI